MISSYESVIELPRLTEVVVFLFNDYKSTHKLCDSYST